MSRTYQGHDGYAPMAAYLGREGYCLEFELREGKQHCQRDTPEFLARVLGRVRRVSDAPPLLRLDGGNDALVLASAALVYNILRWLGQRGLTGPDGPVRRPARRRRIRTVMQELMYLAARFIESARRLKLGFARGAWRWGCSARSTIVSPTVSFTTLAKD